MATKKINVKKATLKEWIILIATAIIALCGGGALGIGITASNKDVEIEVKSQTIELSEEQKEAKVVNEEGVEEIVDLPTVEAIDGNQLSEECKEGEECGRGWYVDTSTPQAFKEAVYGQCIDTDGHFGSQCWDLANLFFQNYAGRTLSTCGTGAAKGTIIDGCWQQNIGDNFDMVWDPNTLQFGDIVVFTNGQFGHIGMAMGASNNGYISLLGTNQGGASCSGGGSSANIINISLKNFGGAFRPKSYIKKEEPKPEPAIPITGCLEWAVEKNDTMLGIGLACENVLMTMPQVNEYAKTWYSRYYVPNQSVWEGWNSKTGVGLYAGDVIDHKIGQ